MTGLRSGDIVALATMLVSFTPDECCARDLDAADPLRRFRERFYVPPGTIYMDGNSLGLLSRDAERSLGRVLDEWRTLAIRGWLEGQQPWFYFAEEVGAKAATLIGASPEEVVLTGTTTANIHALISAFYHPTGRRSKILADVLDFPSDIYALTSQIKLKGLDPSKELVLAPSDDGRIIDEDVVIELMTENVALAFLPTVLYRSGQLLDVARLTEAAHQRGILIGFDACHSVGVIPHEFSRWGVDFAVFCGYKYLNGGPGSPAFLYLNKKHFDQPPALAGWFGSIKERQFDMNHEFTPTPSAGGWQISSPGILGAATLEGALDVTLEAGIGTIRDKSIRMTSYLIELVQAMLLSTPYGFSIGSPLDPKRRGGHVAVEHPSEAARIGSALRDRGLVPDVRPPNVIRMAPIPLYNTYHEIWMAIQRLREVMDTRAYTAYPDQRPAIS